jgi:thiaminase
MGERFSLAEAGHVVTTCNELLLRHAFLWKEATRHPFLDGVRDGSLPSAAFETWLVQDYHFVAAALGFQAWVLGRAPRVDQRVLVNGLSALVEELDWFEGLARASELSLAVSPQPAGRAYAAFLAGLHDAPYVAGVATVWAIERAYLEAWNGVRPGAARYRAYVEHWTTPEFASYVDSLAVAADRALADASPAEARAAEAAFVATAQHERAFWQMAFAASA